MGRDSTAGDLKIQYCYKSEFSLKLIYRFTVTPIIHMSFVETEKLILKFTSRCKGPRGAKRPQERTSWGTNTEGLQASDKAQERQQLNTCMERGKARSRTEDPKTDPHKKRLIGSSGDPGSIPGSGRSQGEGNVNPPQYSCLEDSMDRGAWPATVHGVTKSRTQMSN